MAGIAGGGVMCYSWNVGRRGNNSGSRGRHALIPSRDSRAIFGRQLELTYHIRQESQYWYVWLFKEKQTKLTELITKILEKCTMKLFISFYDPRLLSLLPREESRSSIANQLHCWKCLITENIYVQNRILSMRKSCRFGLLMKYRLFLTLERAPID